MLARVRFHFSLFALLLPLLFLAACSFTVPLPDLNGANPAPDLTLPTPAGEMLSLSDLRGQVVFVNFWGTYCPPCVDEMPDLQATQNVLAGEPFLILGVNVEESPETVIAWTSEHGITFPQVISDDGTINPTLNLRVMPTTWFIDANGILRGRMEGQMDAKTAEKIARILLDSRY
ncbi:MAG: TlpA family protein disulfide reductase [Caldilineales bacterium]|nr:TlpA family protein disulfide reductase [Caldilineales bacterium]